MTRRACIAALTALLTLGLLPSAGAQPARSGAQPASNSSQPDAQPQRRGWRSGAERETLMRYAEDTWASFVAMTDPESGLPADALNIDGRAAGRPPRPTSVPTCGAPSPPRPWGSSIARRR